MATLPYVFVPGTTIASAQVNSDLNTLNTALTLITVNDAGSIQTQQLFEGTTDPTTLGGVTVQDGDLWADG